MSFLQRLLTKKTEKVMPLNKEVIVPENSFCGVFDDDYCMQVITEGRHVISTKYKISPLISLDTHTITIGYPYDEEVNPQVFYKLTVKYKITDPYLYLVNADRGEYISAEATALVNMILWNKNFDEIKNLIGNGYVFQGPAAEMVFNSMEQYGAKILSASCVLSSIEEIRSVPHEEEVLSSGDLTLPYIRGYFYNSTGLSEDDLPN